MAIQYIDGAPSHIEIVIGYSSDVVHTIGGNAGAKGMLLPHDKKLGETWKEFITPDFEVRTTASLANARTEGVVNKVYNGTDRYQTASAVKVLVGGKRLVNGTDYTLQYRNGGIANLYRRPTEGRGAWVYAKAKGAYGGSAETMRYEITSDTTYFLSKSTKSGWDLRLTRKPAEMKSLKRAGYTLDETMHTRSSSLHPVHEYYNAKLKLHRYAFSSDVGKRLVKCGYKAQGIVAYSDPTAYAPNSGKYYAATYHDSKTDKTDALRFQHCGYAWKYGGLAEMDRKMKAKYGLTRTYEMIEYPEAVTW